MKKAYLKFYTGDDGKRFYRIERRAEDLDQPADYSAFRGPYPNHWDAETAAWEEALETGIDGLTPLGDSELPVPPLPPRTNG
jgi:hypothetical protein